MIKKATFSTVLLFTCLYITGCAKPSTAYPELSERAVKGEARYQSSLNSAGKTTSYKNASASVRNNAKKRFNRIAGKIIPAGRALCAELRGSTNNCNYQVTLTDQDDLNAYADGSKIYVTGDMLLFADKDTELANVIAHEYAHNMMQHVQSQKKNVTMGALLGTVVDSLAASQGINTGRLGSQLGAKGAQLRYSKSFEKEADYVGMYIMARAGYSTSNAGDFWRKMAIVSPKGIYVGSTHPTSAQRYVALKQTHQEITDKRIRGAALRPAIRSN